MRSTDRSPSLSRRFFRLAIPNIVSNVTVPAVGLVDAAMLGHLPEIRFLAGVALGSVVFDYVYWGFGFLRMATTGQTAQAVGRGDDEEAWTILWRGLLVAVALGSAIWLLRGAIETAAFALLSGGPGVEAAGRVYFRARIVAAPATLANYVLLGWLLGRERPGRALAMTVFGNLANVALDWLLIMRWGMAAAGAGTATAISQLAMASSGALFVATLPGRRWPRLRRLLDPARLAATFRLHRDILVRTVCLMSTFALFTDFSARLGTAVLACNAILYRVQMLAAYLIDGAAFATETLAGVLYGRRDAAGLRRLLRLALATGQAFAVPVLAVLLLLPGPVVALLTSHAEVAVLVRRFSPWLVPVLSIGAVAFVYDGLLIGLTAGSVLRNQMLVSTLVFFLPLASWAVLSGSNHLLWAAMAVFMFGRWLTLAAGARRILAAMPPLA